ncbi:hypothetical protein SAMN05216352_102162 [Alteribacillus bidgolensis]|uniref:Uncharacterized protein n=1 Tax=Alteribacillus bidgolensis TaxID=930129 RepID=A0A1G8ECL2_9BACI|nr:hypothetical protein SAMN05216352_102162 [Alteribacillus bidgolensis]
MPDHSTLRDHILSQLREIVVANYPQKRFLSIYLDHGPGKKKSKAPS